MSWLHVKLCGFVAYNLQSWCRLFLKFAFNHTDDPSTWHKHVMITWYFGWFRCISPPALVEIASKFCVQPCRRPINTTQTRHDCIINWIVMLHITSRFGANCFQVLHSTMPPTHNNDTVVQGLHDKLGGFVAYHLHIWCWLLPNVAFNHADGT